MKIGIDAADLLFMNCEVIGALEVIVVRILEAHIDCLSSGAGTEHGVVLTEIDEPGDEASVCLCNAAECRPGSDEEVVGEAENENLAKGILEDLEAKLLLAFVGKLNDFHAFTICCWVAKERFP